LVGIELTDCFLNIIFKSLIDKLGAKLLMLWLLT